MKNMKNILFIMIIILNTQIHGAHSIETVYNITIEKLTLIPKSKRSELDDRLVAIVKEIGLEFNKYYKKTTMSMMQERLSLIKSIKTIESEDKSYIPFEQKLGRHIANHRYHILYVSLLGISLYGVYKNQNKIITYLQNYFDTKNIDTIPTPGLPLVQISFHKPGSVL